MYWINTCINLALIHLLSARVPILAILAILFIPHPVSRLSQYKNSDSWFFAYALFFFDPGIE